MKEQYVRHISEKDKVREIKSEKKKQAVAQPKKAAAVYDLQQVIYLPKSGRGTLFYKRRLGCYNFTIYDLGSKDGFCFLHHEGNGKRGSNEIASNLYTYLQTLDTRGVEIVDLFSDGCIGQNKNSILPAMLLYFISVSVSVKQVTQYYFETSHGQSEGDSIHSTVERSLAKTGDVFLPSQLAILIETARKHPARYKVKEVQSKDIRDWKQLSQALRILKVRSTEEGNIIDWTKVMQVKVTKNQLTKLHVKFSHLSESFDTINITGSCRHVQVGLHFPGEAYPLGPPRISEGKFQDLMSLCEGLTPVISHPDHVAFYKHLPH